MDARIDELTPEQEALIDQIADEYLTSFYSCKPLDEEAAEKGIKAVYALADLPEPQVYFADSPLGAQIMCAYLRELEKEGEVKQGDRVWDRVRDRVGDRVWARVRARVEFEPFALTGVWDRNWVSFYDYFERIGLDLECPEFSMFRAFIRSGVYDTIQFESCAIVVLPPSKIVVDAEGNLHATDGVAVEWPDGYGERFLWGVGFDDDLHERVCSGAMSAKDVLAIENIEQRRAALRLLGPEKILASLESRLIDSQEGYELYEVPKITERMAYALKYKCPSTEREYVSFVRPEVGEQGDAIAAIASKWKLTKEQWRDIGAHS